MLAVFVTKGKFLEKPKLHGPTNKFLPDASEKLSVKSSKNMGRYIVANQNIGIGETLVVEPPYVACLLPEMFGTHCHHCLKRLELFIVQQDVIVK